MPRYTFATKFKKIEKEPLYYNIQVSVDKDVRVKIAPTMDGFLYYTFYANNPIILKKETSNRWIDDEKKCKIYYMNNFINFYLETALITHIYQGYDYPFPEIISVVAEGVTFTFTPIPVYE